MANAQREISLVFRAYDEFTLQMEKFKTSVAGAGAAGSAAAKELTSSWSSGIAGIKSAWLEIGAIVASAAWFISAHNDALEAEIAFNKLRIQVAGLGLNFKEVEPVINSVIDATSKYAIVQDEKVAGTLQKLIFYSGNYAGSLKNLNLTYDLAYMKGIDAAEAATLVGKAMSGNIERLGRLFPELHNSAEKLGAFATNSEKAAYAQIFLEEKVNKASEQMTEHEKSVLRANKAYEDFKQTVGGALLILSDVTIQTATYWWNLFADAMQRTGEAQLIAAGGIEEFNNQTAEEITNTKFAMAVQQRKALVHKQTAEQMAADIKKNSDISEAENKRKEATLTLDKSLAEQVFNLQKETNKLSMEEASYQEWEKGSLLLKGASIEAINALTAAQHNLNNAKLKEAEIKAAAEARKSLGEGAQQAPEVIGGFKPSAEEAEARGMRKNINALQKYYGERAQLLITAGANENEIKQNTEEANFAIQDQAMRLEFATREQTSLQRLSSLEAVETARVNVLGSANKAMEAQMLRMVEVGKFSAAEFGKTVIQAVKMELLGLAARAAVLSLFYTAMSFIPGYQYAAAAAVGFAVASVAAYAAAAGVQAAFGGTVAGSGASRSTASTGGGAQPSFNATPAGFPVPASAQAAPTQGVTINIYNPLSEQNWQKIVEDNIVPAINAATDRNVVLNVAYA